MRQGWSYDDIANADYYHLMRILGDKNDKQDANGNIRMDLADLVEKI